MKNERIELWLELIREAAGNATGYIEGLQLEDFLKDRRTRDAVAMNLLVVGENVARLARRYPEFLEEHSETPWRSAIGMRNRIAHGYEGIDFTIVWQTTIEYLPELLGTLPAYGAAT